MDNKAAACEEVSQELARESLIGISYCIPGKVPNSEIVPQAVNVEEKLPVMNGDGAEKFTISWPVLLESLQFFCVNYTVKLLDRDATQGSGPATQHPCRKATFLLATMWERTPKNTAIESHFNCDQYLLCFPGHFGSSIQKSPCTRDSDVLCALSLMNQPGTEEVVKDSTSCSRWKEDEKEW
ncbi:hypothetical protein NC652_008690 [Populus alba x Populus x berolinensis]|nr:hypothetical protein NC652_008690 [Populus alba x Populus x berolinensis]